MIDIIWVTLIFLLLEFSAFPVLADVTLSDRDVEQYLALGLSLYEASPANTFSE